MIVKGKEYTDHEASLKFMDDFCDLIDSLKESNEDRGMVVSYQSIAPTDRIPEDDVWVFESDLHDLGWDRTTLSLLFSKLGKVICDDLSSHSRGAGDVFLWKWSGGKFDIGGCSWKDMSDTFDEDVMIKYAYGWQRHRYGQIFLEQNGYDTDKFLNQVSKSFWVADIEPFLYGRLHSEGVPTPRLQKLQTLNKIIDNKISIPYKKIVDMINVIIFTEGNSDKEDTITHDYFLEFIRSAANVYSGSSYEETEDSITCEFGT